MKALEEMAGAGLAVLAMNKDGKTPRVMAQDAGFVEVSDFLFKREVRAMQRVLGVRFYMEYFFPRKG